MKEKSTLKLFSTFQKKCVSYVSHSQSKREKNLDLSYATGNIMCGICWLLSGLVVYYVEKLEAIK